MSSPEPVEPTIVDARFNGGSLEVSTEPLVYDPAITLVTVRGGATDLALFADEARALSLALNRAADHVTAALAAERRRAPGRETESAPHLEMRMESADDSVDGASDIAAPTQRDGAP